MNKQLLLLCAAVAMILTGTSRANAQGMAINSSGAAAAGSAALDITSSTQGVLVPRMLSTDRGAISSPATGLLVYQTDAPAGFYYYTGSGWLALNSTSATAGGDLTGSYPSPTIAANAVTGTKIATGTITGSKIAASTITTTNISASGTASASTYLRGDGSWTTPSSSATGSAGGDLTGTYPNPSLAVTTVTAGSYGSATQVPTYTVDSKGRITAASNTTISGIAPSGSAGGELTGTYPNPTLAVTTVTAGSYGSATQVPTYTVDSKGRITAASNTTISGIAPSGSAGGDLTSSYPNPTIASGAVTGSKIASGTITGSNIAATTISTTNLSASGTASATTFLKGNNTWGGVDLSTAAATGTLAAARMPALTGDVTTSAGAVATTLANSGVTAATYGDATHIPVVTIDAKGRVTTATTTAISAGGGITFNTLSATASNQSYNYTSTTNRFFFFDQTNSTFWATAEPLISVTISAASAYPAGTQLKFSVVNNPDPGYYPKWQLTTSSSSFKCISSAGSGGTTATLDGFSYFTLISDGSSVWYITD